VRIVLGLGFLAALVGAPARVAWAQGGGTPFHVFDGAGKPAQMADIVEAAKSADVLFLGENHDDALAHKAELALFMQVFTAFGKDRPVVLSLEMFERDEQTVLDEYLKGIIPEKQFLACARPWDNYMTDYRPMVEFAREHGIPVMAANAPRRYVSVVAKQGRGVLDGLSAQGKSWIAPLPYPAASAAYAAKFNALMGGAHGGGMGGNLLDSQVLWDATMADSIVQALKARPGALVVQVNGRFHSEGKLGTAEQVLGYRPGTKAVVVGLVPGDGFTKELAGSGDFVVVTAPQVTTPEQ
jgi:uncharacterized iron-regulated protein